MDPHLAAVIPRTVILIACCLTMLGIRMDIQRAGMELTAEVSFYMKNEYFSLENEDSSLMNEGSLLENEGFFC